MIKKLSLLLLFLSISLNAFAKNVQSLDRIVAVVNDDVVTRSELDRALDIVGKQLTQEKNMTSDKKELQKQVLNQLINKKIQLQIAEQAGIRATEEDLNNAIGHIAQQNHMSTNTLYQRLHEEGMTTKDYRNEIREQITLGKLQRQQINSRITVSPQEVTSFMHSQMWQSNGSKEYHLEDILIPISDTPSTEEIKKAKAQADAVLAKLRHGQNFNTIAQAESGSSQALQGGDLGWRSLAEIPSAFAEQAANMKVKEINGPIQTPNGFHIIRLAGKRSTATKENKNTLNQQQIEQLLMQQKFEEALQNWVSKLRSQAFVKINL